MQGKSTLEEGRTLKQVQKEIEECVHKWKLRSAALGVAFLITALSVIPFIDGHSLHSQWSPFGKNLVLASMFLFTALIYVIATTYNFQRYLKAIRKIRQQSEES